MSDAAKMNAAELTEPFVCDACRIEHPPADLGKNTGVQADHEGCTGRLCKRCTFGDRSLNRAQRRAGGKAERCRTDCRG